MPFYVTKDNQVEMLSFVTPEDRQRFEDLCAREPNRVFATMTGALLHFPIQAASFADAVRAEPLYCANEALSRKLGDPLPKPIGIKSDYRIEAYLDQRFPRPRRPEELAELEQDHVLSPR